MASFRRSSDLRRLAIAHGLSSAGDACVTVSLADSLFFNISVEAARPRLLLYLALTMAPFAILAPLIGPLIDRFRGARRIVLLVTMIARAALTLTLIQDLRSLLMFPEVFGVLVLGKAYSIARSATVPLLVAEENDLVAANAFLARVSLVATSVAGAGAALALQVGGATLALYVATVLFVLAGIVIVTMPSHLRTPGGRTRLEYHELHTVRLTRAVYAVGLLRGSVGLLTFLFAFALKRAGAPVWQFGLVLVAGGVGAFTATALSNRIRRLLGEERTLVLSLALPALAALMGVTLQFGTVVAVAVSGILALVAAIAKHVFDALVQGTAPDADMARAFAGFESRFQMFWIGGAALAVLAQPDPRLGLLVMSLVLGGGAIAVDRALHSSDQFEPTPSLVAAVTQLVLEDAPSHDAPNATLDAADVLARGGSTDAAVIVATAALDARQDLEPTLSGDAATALAAASVQLHALRDAVVSGRLVAAGDVERAIAVARAALNTAGPRTDREIR